MQQTFINAYKRAVERRGAGAGRAAAVALPGGSNAALNVARDPQSGLDELPGEPRRRAAPRRGACRRASGFQRVVGAVNKLPPKQRQVIVRHALDGESHERIATDLGMSAGSIRQLVHRARQTVRGRLRPCSVPLAAAALSCRSARTPPRSAAERRCAKVAVAVVVVGAAGGGARAGRTPSTREQPAVAEVAQGARAAERPRRRPR